MEFRVEVDQRDLTRLTTALRQEADGKQLRKDLVDGLKKAAEPAAAAARASILSMPVSGLTRATPGLRATVAAATKVSVRTSGRAGVFVVVGKGTMPRDFPNAPSRLNARKGWRRRVFGTDKWVTQVGKPGWFDDTMHHFDPIAERAAKEAMDDVAKRIETQTK